MREGNREGKRGQWRRGRGREGGRGRERARGGDDDISSLNRATVESVHAVKPGGLFS